MSTPPEAPRRRRRVLALAAAALLGAGLAALLLLPRALEWALLRSARALGVAPLELSVKGVGWGRLELADVRLGGAGEISLARASAEWSLAGLFARRFDRVVLEGLRVRARLAEDGLHIAPLDPLLRREPDAGEGPAALPALPLAALVVRDARAEIDTPAGPVTASADGELLLEGLVLDGRASAASQDGRLRLDAEMEADTGKGRIAIGLRELELAGTASGISAEGAIEVAREGSTLRLRSAPGPRFQAAAPPLAGEIVLDAELRYAGGRLTVHPRACTGVRFSQASLAGRGALAAPLLLCAEPGDEPTLDVGLAAPASPGVRAQLRLARAEFALALARPTGSPLAVRGALPRLALDGNLGREGALVARGEASGGRIEVPGVAPLGVSGRLEIDGDALRFAGRVEQDSDLVVSVEGEHWRAARLGEARIDVEPLDLAHLPRIAPGMRRQVSDTAGTLGGGGVVRWSPRGLDSNLHADLREVGAASGAVRLEGVNGRIALAGWPPRTRKSQRVTAKSGVLVAPFSDGVLDFDLDGAQRVGVRGGRMATLGGSASATGRLDPRAPRQALDLRLAGLELARILEWAEVGGLSGAGTLDGEVRAILAGGALHFEAGSFRARPEGGTIRYRPPGQAPVDMKAPQGLDLARAALDNFHFQKLGGTVEGAAAGDMDMSLQLEGANPDLYQGHPVRLDLNLNGPLLGLARSSQTVMGLPQRIEERMQEKISP